MKIFVFIASLLLLNGGDWLYNYEQSKVLAKKENKPILLSFSGSDWCAPCIKMKRQIFDRPEFRSYASRHLILLKADFPRQKKNQLDQKQKEHNEKLAERYNPNGKFPLTLLLSAEGVVIREWDGYTSQSAEGFVEQLRTVSHAK